VREQGVCVSELWGHKGVYTNTVCMCERDVGTWGHTTTIKDILGELVTPYDEVRSEKGCRFPDLGRSSCREKTQIPQHWFCVIHKIIQDTVDRP